MSIKEIKSGTLYKEYSLEIPYEEINEIIDSKIQELLPTVSLPGFRKGKAPLSIVRKKYENNVLSEAVENLVQSKTKDLLEKRNLKPFTQPKIDLKKHDQELSSFVCHVLYSLQIHTKIQPSRTIIIIILRGEFEKLYKWSSDY